MSFDEIVGYRPGPAGWSRATRGPPFRAAMVSTRYPNYSSISITAAIAYTGPAIQPNVGARPARILEATGNLPGRGGGSKSSHVAEHMFDIAEEEADDQLP